MAKNELIIKSQTLQKRYGLEDWHVQLLHYLMLPKALRPSSFYIQKKLNISTQVYYNWLRHPAFNEARRELIRQYFIDDIPDVIMAMKNEALSGNERAARLFLEYVDEWKTDIAIDNSVSIPNSEVKIIINNLHQKFYGVNQPRENREINDGAVIDI